MVYSASLDFKLLRNDFTFDSGSAGPSEKKSDSNKEFTSYEREGISNSLSVNWESTTNIPPFDLVAIREAGSTLNAASLSEWGGE